MSQITIQEAEFLTGLTRQAINYATKNGSLSYTLNERNIKVVDVSELQRAGYSFVKTMDELEDFKKNGKRSNAVKSRKKDNVKSVSNDDLTIQLIQQELSSTKKLLETLEKERNRERNLYEQQMDTLAESLKISQETAKSATLMLEDKSKNQNNDNGWQKSLKALESRIANQEKGAKEKAETDALEKTALEKQLTEQKKEIEEQAQALQEAKDAELKRKEEEYEAAQTWVSKMFGKKKTA